MDTESLPGHHHRPAVAWMTEVQLPMEPFSDLRPMLIRSGHFGGITLVGKQEKTHHRLLQEGPTRLKQLTWSLVVDSHQDRQQEMSSELTVEGEAAEEDTTAAATRRRLRLLPTTLRGVQQ
jgi:hypothetical protein